MSKRKNKKMHIGVISFGDIYKMSKPRSYQVVTGRGGVHGDTKYNRRKAKAEARRIIDDEM